LRQQIGDDDGGEAMELEIRTAAELIDLDIEGRGRARRAARETELMRRVFQAFVDRAGSVPVDEIVSAFPDRAPEHVRETLTKLDAEDLIRLGAGRVDLAYPFSGVPTAFVVDLGEGRGPRYICCAIDALGMAPMLGRRVGVRSWCHHCAAAMELTVDPLGPGSDATGVMVWVGKRPEDDRRACDSL
jgi:Alkylmercury lyase